MIFQPINNPEQRMFVLHSKLPQTILLAAISRLASLETIAGDFPPNSKVTGVRFSAAAL
jgi:hypothetical protein